LRIPAASSSARATSRQESRISELRVGWYDLRAVRHSKEAEPLLQGVKIVKVVILSFLLHHLTL
jgi:hypothetical protein